MTLVYPTARRVSAGDRNLVTRGPAWSSRSVCLLLMTATLTAASPTCLAQWSLSVEASASSKLVDPWEDYFGIHYLTVDDFEPQWFDNPVFATVRDYAFPGLPRTKTDDGAIYDVTRMSRYINNDPLVGPFTGEPVYVGLQDVANGHDQSFLDTMPDILANDLTVVFTAESTFPIESTSSVDKDYIYWTLRQTYEAFPDAVDNIIWQWGNEINADGDIFSPSRANDPAGVPFYVDNYLAPAIEAIQKVEADLIANGTFAPGTHIPIATGSFANVSGVANRAWMEDVMNYTITDANVTSDQIVGKQTWELVDILTGHYPGPTTTLDTLKTDWLDTGKVDSVWITEDHGQRGQGPADLAARAVRYLDWAVNNQMDSDTSRVFWWSTDATDDPGGQGIEAVDLLGSIFSGKTLYETMTDLDGIEAYVILTTDDTGDGSLTLIAIPQDYPRQPEDDPFAPGTITFELPDGMTLVSAGEAGTYQLSVEQPTESWVLPVDWTPGGSLLSLDLLNSAGTDPHMIDGTLLVSIPVQLLTVPEPTTAPLLLLTIGGLIRRRPRP